MIRIVIAMICSVFGIRPKMRMSTSDRMTMPCYMRRVTRDGCAFLLA